MLWKLYFTTTKPYKGNFNRNFKKDGSDVKKNENNISDAQAQR